MLEKAKGLNFVFGNKVLTPQRLGITPRIIKKSRGEKKAGKCKIVCLVATCTLCTLTPPPSGKCQVSVCGCWIIWIMRKKNRKSRFSLCGQKIKIMRKKNRKSRFSLCGQKIESSQVCFQVFHFYAISEALPLVSRVNAILSHILQIGKPTGAVVFCKKTNVRFLSAALADKSHLILRVIRKIYKKIKRTKFCFLPQP